MRIEILNNLYGVCSQGDDREGSLEAVKELVEVQRPISAAGDAERQGQPDLTLIFYIYNLAELYRKNNKLDEAAEVVKELRSLLAKVTAESPKSKQLNELVGKLDTELKGELEKRRQ